MYIYIIPLPSPQEIINNYCGTYTYKYIALVYRYVLQYLLMISWKDGKGSAVYDFTPCWHLYDCSNLYCVYTNINQQRHCTLSRSISSGLDFEKSHFTTNL